MEGALGWVGRLVLGWTGWGEHPPAPIDHLRGICIPQAPQGFVSGGVYFQCLLKLGDGLLDHVICIVALSEVGKLQECPAPPR